MNCEQSFTEIDFFLFLRHCLTKPAVTAHRTVSWLSLFYISYDLTEGRGQPVSVSLCVFGEAKSKELGNKIQDAKKCADRVFTFVFPSIVKNWGSAVTVLNVVTKFHKLLHCSGSKYSCVFICFIDNIIHWPMKEKSKIDKKS